MLLSSLIAQADPNTIFGVISPPPGVSDYDTASGGDIGLIFFISNLLKFATVVAGLWVLLQLFLAGFQYITSNGDTGAHKKVSDRITMSVVGLVIIISSYTIAGIIGLIFFGDALFILNPTISGPNPTGTP